MRGRILFNGNLGGALLERVQPYILASGRGRAPNVLIVTAAWGRGEYDEAPIKAELNRLGIPSDVRDGYDRNLVNLAAWHAWAEYLQKHRDVAAVVEEIDAVSDELRALYVERTRFDADFIRKGVRAARRRVPRFRLGHVTERDGLRPESVHTGAELLELAIGKELDASITALRQNDERMLSSLLDAEEQMLARTGVRLDPEWRAIRQGLEAKILAADAILLFGGSPQKLLAPFRFFDLRPALLETLRRGATMVATSAGALVLCERMIVYDDYAGDPSSRDFRLLDRGLGLVGGLQIMPHCMDRIQTDDPDNLAYLARRFSRRLCAGLNEESFLLVDMEGPTATSVGIGDGVYVFGPDGRKTCYTRGERIPLA